MQNKAWGETVQRAQLMVAVTIASIKTTNHVQPQADSVYKTKGCPWFHHTSSQHSECTVDESSSMMMRELGTLILCKPSLSPVSDEKLPARDPLLGLVGI